MKYKTILADPPWNERGAGRIRRGADRHYSLMKTKDIISMGEFVKELSNESCHLYLWVTNNFLLDGLSVMKAWGFRYISVITWFKDRIGLGQYLRGITEQCLFGVKGRYLRKGQGVTGFYEKRRAHSQKPEEIFRIIEEVSFPPRIELFARQKRRGWDAWGNEV